MVAPRRKLNVDVTFLMDEKLSRDILEVAKLAGLSRGEYMRRVLRSATRRHRTLRPAMLRSAVKTLQAQGDARDGPPCYRD